MNKNAPFLKDYNPAGRVVFALTPAKVFIDMFTQIMEITGRKLPALLVSMHYLQGEGGGVKLQILRDLCEHLMVDSGVFSLRSQVFKDQDISIRIAHWKLDPAAQARLIEICKEKEEMFDSFAQDYAVFLERNASSIDVAIDLDVEQMLGMDKAEEYYILLKQHIEQYKLMRVWHAFLRTWQDWVDWCESGEHAWLAMEGPDQHNRDPSLYSRFIVKAHECNVKVHILATTTLKFLSQVPMDTCDSSTYTVGGRWARLIIPNGDSILVGENYKQEYGNHYRNLAKAEQARILEIFEYFGFTLDELSESHMARCLFNAFVFLHHFDKPMPVVTNTQVLF